VSRLAGVSATAVILGEAGLCLALDSLTECACILTPASAMGGVFTERLRKAGFTIAAARMSQRIVDGVGDWAFAAAAARPGRRSCRA